MKNFSYTLTDFPDELMQEIAQYLEPKDLVNLKIVLEGHFVKIDKNSSAKFDVLWQPILNELKKQYPSINIQPPANASPLWRYEQVKNFLTPRIKLKSQQKQINNLMQKLNLFYPTYAHTVGDAQYNKFKAIENELKQLDFDFSLDNLKMAASFLKKINAFMIQSNIILSQSNHLLRYLSLDLTDKGLVEWPANFKTLAGPDYWASLRQLILSDNDIRVLPPSCFGDLPKLASVKLFYNHIKNLPMDAFKGSNKIVRIEICEPDLESLSEGLFEPLVELKRLTLNFTRLKNLPENCLRGLVKLESINLSDNQLEFLPRNLFKDLTSLQLVVVSNNPLNLGYKPFIIDNKQIKLLDFKKLLASSDIMPETTFDDPSHQPPSPRKKPGL